MLPSLALRCAYARSALSAGRLDVALLAREKCEVGPNYASWSVHSCGNTAMKD
jgi:hypothetical protein